MSKEEEVKKASDGSLEQGEFKIPKKKRGRPKKLVKKEQVSKIDLSKKEKDAVQESSTEKIVLQSTEQGEEKGKEIEVGLQEVGSTHEEEKPTEEVEEKLTPIIEIQEEVVEEKTEEKVVETKVEEKRLPENIEKLVSFMEETGGTVEDYVRINADYSSVDNNALLNEYYKQTKPHLNQEEINFIMEDSFSYDEEMDEEREIRKKKLAYKEEIAKAKGFLENMKDKYYAEIKSRPGVTQEQQKAVDFFNQYNKDQEMALDSRRKFLKRTEDFFQNKFKGFEFSVGEKRFNYKVNSNTKEFIDNQKDIDNIFKRFLDKEGKISNLNEYHKAIYAAHNVDSIANHFYEQGKADATRDVIAKSKNITNDTRPVPNGDTFINGIKVKSVSGADSSKLKIRYKNKR
jgi:hypothetical protein